jgi:alpha-galactosidase
MPIYFENNTFHLCNHHISYVFKILKNGQLGHLYYGKRLNHRSNFDYMLLLNSRPNTTYLYEDDPEFSFEYIKQEYPSYGSTDYSEGAYQILQENGSIITNFTYHSHHINPGKPNLMEGLLPATYVETDDEATTLTILLKDQLIGCDLFLQYTIYENRDVICRNSQFINNGSQKLKLNRALSMSIDFDDSNYEMVHLSGAWARERHEVKRTLSQGIQSISSTRGASSAHQNPFVALKRRETTESTGEVYGFSFVYSGDFLAHIEVNHYDLARLTMGINPFTFKWNLEPGTSFQTPEVVLVYSDQGLNGMSQIYHQLYRERLVRGKWRDQSSPILVNNWEATYFNFNEEKLLEMAEVAKEVGIEMFVLDDGWFGKRNDDRSSLGDWYPDKRKLPNGLNGLCQKVNDLGLKFGLWLEPEMVNKESELYKNHPDWIIETPNRHNSHGRNQYILDFSRLDVIDYLYQTFSAILKSTNIVYIKWDMNRNFTEPFSSSLSAKQQSELSHRYILGVYTLYNKLTSEFPDVLFESCASGGGRFDPGMLYYAPQGWISDNTDAIERLKIQYGTSFVYPLKTMGSHVSSVPNHQVHRITPLETRANVAYFGTFGYELDLTSLSSDEKDAVKQQIVEFKKIQSIIHYGVFYRLLSPFEGNNKVAWLCVSNDQSEAVMGVYQILATPNPGFNRIRLQGLKEDLNYVINFNNEQMYSGRELMNFGIVMDNVHFGSSDFSSTLLHLTAVN